MNDVTFRRATSADLSAIVGMLADDVLGATRERFDTPPTRELPRGIRGDRRDLLEAVELAAQVLATIAIALLRSSDSYHSRNEHERKEPCEYELPHRTLL